MDLTLSWIPLSHCNWSQLPEVFWKNPPTSKNFWKNPPTSNRDSWVPKMGDGRVFHTSCPDFFRPVELEYRCLLKSTFTQTSHDSVFKTLQTPTTYPECLFCEESKHRVSRTEPVFFSVQTTIRVMWICEEKAMMIQNVLVSARDRLYWRSIPISSVSRVPHITLMGS